MSEKIFVGFAGFVVDTLGNGKVANELVVAELHRCIEVDLHDASEVHGDVADGVINVGPFVVFDRDKSNTGNVVVGAASDCETVVAVIAAFL